MTEKLNAASAVKTRRVLVNMVEGRMVVEFEAKDREALENWLKAEGLHYNFLMRVEFESTGAELAPV